MPSDVVPSTSSVLLSVWLWAAVVACTGSSGLPDEEDARQDVEESDLAVIPADTNRGGETDDAPVADVDAAADLDAGSCRTLGCPCAADRDCEASFCVGHPDGGSVCSERCTESCSIEGYECRTLRDAGDIVRYCVPVGDPYCAPCDIDADCLSTSNACVELADGRFCATGCAEGERCPDGASCTSISVGGARRQVCVPTDDQCTGCLDADGDRRGVGPRCLGLDCDDDDATVYEGAPEWCDGKDNDCDERVDEDFVGLGEACGTCDSGSLACRDLAAVCVGDAGAAALNACGGCASLPGTPGGSCGECAAVWACDGVDAMSCVGDSTDSDSDGVCDPDDACPGYDDRHDADGDGVPDGCDIAPPACTTARDCGDDSIGEWGECGGFDGPCATDGARTRSLTEWICVEGACQTRIRVETGACARSTEGSPCGSTEIGPWGLCDGFDSVCDESGTRSRTVTSYVCGGSVCQARAEAEVEACEIDTDGTSCAGSEVGEWGPCLYPTECAETGSQSRSRTDYACVGGRCTAAATTERDTCTRDTDGTWCEDWPGCRFTTCSGGVCPVGPGCSAGRRCCEPGICISTGQFCP